MNKDLKKDYKKAFNALRNILNSIDPEDLQPGQEDGTPIDEYDDEVSKIHNFITHNLEEVKINKQLLTKEISKIWMDSFEKECDSVNEIASRIIKELF